jgi:hypothetical protein
MNCQPPIIKLIVPDFRLKPLKQFLETVLTNQLKKMTKKYKNFGGLTSYAQV